MHIMTHPKGCDTFVAYPPTTASGHVVFGKNSDRPSGESQPLKRYPRTNHPENSTLKCTYISIPQARETFGVLVSQIDWMWGCEHGANEHGVVIGNEAVWTKVPEEVDDDGNHKKLLLGMDLVRLGLERERTSWAALEVITGLLEDHGQGGPCAEDDPSFTYHNSFLIADAKEAYILETAGRHWVAQKWTTGARNISNGLTIRTNFDFCSKGIREYATTNGLWDGIGSFDFAESFAEGGAFLGGRQGRGQDLLDAYSGSERFDKDAMVSILRDHEGGICMHGSDFETTAAMVSELFSKPSSNKHWATGPHPCSCFFSLQEI
mmetsp:Transcript_12342/g.25491  ORF Transcript_12342/g.25491 Transcript_12342/m.25491 type:complete len:321 (-) Transcript_12342:528-1490(-)